jgi:hypothetical protein
MTVVAAMVAMPSVRAIRPGCPRGDNVQIVVTARLPWQRAASLSSRRSVGFFRQAP